MNNESKFQRILISVAQIVLLLVFTAVAVWLIVRFRDVIVAVGNKYMAETLAIWLRNRYIWLVDVIGTFLLVAAFLGFLAFTDSYLQNGKNTGQFWQRAGKIALVQAILLALSFALSFLFQ